MFVLPFAENYLTQLVSLSLWPFAIAATISFARRPAVGTALLAAIGLGAVAGVYPQLAPWLGPPALLLVLVVARGVRPALVALGGLALALVIVAPIVLVRAYHSVVLFSGTLDSNPGFPRLQAEQDLGIVLGGVSQFSVPACRAPSSSRSSCCSWARWRWRSRRSRPAHARSGA